MEVATKTKTNESESMGRTFATKVYYRRVYFRFAILRPFDFSPIEKCRKLIWGRTFATRIYSETLYFRFAILRPLIFHPLKNVEN